MINSLSNRLIVTISILTILIQVNYLSAQDSLRNIEVNDTLRHLSIDTSNKVLINDSLGNITPDSTKADSLHLKKKGKKSEIEDPVKYSAKDSLYFDLIKKKVYLYGDAHVTYQNIDLTAAYIEFDMGQETVYATGAPDSSGTIAGYPDFKEGSEEFNAHWLRYNFKTKKGFIQFVKTKQDNGTLIGDSTKRQPNGNINLKGGKYSTCDLDHPHFYIGLMKAKSVPGDKIVSGPAYLAVADIPLPLILPFGFFPNTKGISSGILPPTWGEEKARGFFLSDGGYYFAFSDYFDMQLRGSLYSNGSWGTQEHINYKKRYRFGGSFDFSYRVNKNSEIGLPDYSVVKDYAITWSHIQDQKSNPNNSFSASVNMSSSTYDKHNSYNLNDIVTNTKTSSITYSHNWPNSPFHFTTNLNQTQSSLTKEVNMTLPDMSFTMNTIYPFRREEMVGEPKWYDNVQIGYDAHLSNAVNTNDSDIFTKNTFKNVANGFKHHIQPSISFKLNNFMNLTPSVAYDGVVFSRHINETAIFNPKDSSYHDSISTIHQITYAHAFTPGISLGASPKFYGMYNFKNSKIKALRHVISPSATISFTPDIRKILPKYYDTVRVDKKTVRTYSHYDNINGNQIYSTPYPPGGKSANISMSLRNNFDIKYLSTTDTASAEKKFSILDNLDFSANYNLIADSFNLSNISMNTGTHLFDNNLTIQLNANFDPYAVDNTGRDINSYELTSHGRLARLTSATLSLSTSFKSSQGKKPGDNNQASGTDQQNKPNPQKVQEPYGSDEVNFDIPWNVNISYNFGYQLSRSQNKLQKTYNMSSTFSGDMSLTKRWKIGVKSGYDFQSKQLTLTSVDISRDLHCWQMTFNWIPFGYYSRYMFTISAVAPILRDLKYTKQSDARTRF